VVDAVLLDVDGTLIDSNDAHARAWVDAAAEFGFDIAFDQVRPLIGMGGDRVLPALTGLQEESDLGERLLDRRGEIFRERYLPSLQPCKGAQALLQKLEEHGIRSVVATSASEEDLEPLLDRIGIRREVDDATNSDDAESSKPSPDIIEAAIEQAGAEPAAIIMIGDTPYDIEAARRAGVSIVAVRCGGWWDDAALAGADAIYDDPAHIVREWERSPFFAKRGGPA
jgi:HAD superfamily hydrolase (TIGR01509 family)